MYCSVSCVTVQRTCPCPIHVVSDRVKCVELRIRSIASYSRQLPRTVELRNLSVVRVSHRHRSRHTPPPLVGTRDCTIIPLVVYWEHFQLPVERPPYSTCSGILDYLLVLYCCTSVPPVHICHAARCTLHLILNASVSLENDEYTFDQ